MITSTSFLLTSSTRTPLVPVAMMQAGNDRNVTHFSSFTIFSMMSMASASFRPVKPPDSLIWRINSSTVIGPLDLDVLDLVLFHSNTSYDI